MFSRRFVLPTVLSLVVAACTAGQAIEPSPTTIVTTTSSTTTTSTLPTTTTLPPVSIEGADAELSTAIDDFYSYAITGTGNEPVVPAPLLAKLTGTTGQSPTDGVAVVNTFLGEQVGVVELSDDVFLVVDDGSGWRIVGGMWPSIGVDPYWGDGPRIVAVLGTDARPKGDMMHANNDSIHFVGLDGEGGGAVVGLPRDSYIDIPGIGKRKATAALPLGGPDTMMQTFTDLTGLPLEGYVLTGFKGFQELAGVVLGGIEVDVPRRINDRWAHVTLEAGRQILDGAQALGFARARKTVGGDLVRSGHQGIILLAAAGMVQAMGYSAIPGLLEAAEPHIATNLTPEQLLTFSAMAISADLDNMANVVAQGRTGTAAGASVVFLDDSVSDLWADLADGTLEEAG